MGQANSRNIGKLVADALASFDIPVTNCMAFALDNAKVMIGKKDGVAALLMEVHEKNGEVLQLKGLPALRGGHISC